MKLRILWRDRSNSSRLSPAPIRGPARGRVKAINAITTTTSIREKPFTLSQDAGKAQKDEGRICNFAQVLRISNEQSPMVTDRQFGSSFCIQQHRRCKRMLQIADWGLLNANCPALVHFFTAPQTTPKPTLKESHLHSCTWRQAAYALHQRDAVHRDGAQFRCSGTLLSRVE